MTDVISCKQKLPGKILTPEEILKQAKDTQNERPKQRQRDIEAIREWIRSQPHLGENAKQDDVFITAFLRGCKYSYEKTKKKIDTWHTVRTHAPDIFGGWDLDDPNVAQIVQFGPQVPLKGYDKHGRKVFLIRSSYLDHSRVKLPDSIRAGLMINELFMSSPCHDEQATVTGVVMINDLGQALFYLQLMWGSFRLFRHDNHKYSRFIPLRFCQFLSFGIILSELFS